ncbi:MAG TPA: AAA family ATPase [Anaerolineaceae bacterium]|nr:AAA family ATPase [Anaerolineaceae bacterium]
MMNICHRCGLYRADKLIDPKGPFAVCPECGYKHLFRQLPLFVVSGASGTGKTTILQKLLGRLDEFVLLDSDILWRAEFNNPEDNYRSFFEIWLRVAKNIAQSGRPVMLFGAGAGVPANIEPCVERRYFSRVHYLALTCEEEVLRRRLVARPEWRGTHAEEFIRAQVEFNDWFKQSADREDDRIELLDTTHDPVETTAAAVAAWAKKLATVLAFEC